MERLESWRFRELVRAKKGIEYNRPNDLCIAEVFHTCDQVLSRGVPTSSYAPVASTVPDLAKSYIEPS